MTSPAQPPQPPPKGTAGSAAKASPAPVTPIVDELDSSSDTSDHEYDDPPEEEIIESEHSPRPSPGPRSPSPKTGEPRVKTNFHDRGKTPAHVTPIPKIGRISPVHGISTHNRPSFPVSLTSRFTGKVIDEYGDVHEDGPDSALLGRVAGDLPSMVGRTVSTDAGDVLDDDGSLLGYIQDIEGYTPSQSLDEYTGGGSSGFRVDADGQILDAAGNVVGRMNTPAGGKKDGSKSPSPDEKTPEGKPPPVNAESFRQESPSDIFLDVKSTTEGIQLTIRIPTVFPGNGQPPRVPKVSFA
ncbi:hypothetical protein SBRCBS47491_001861 [Sporothrix bragantina]|uniref:Lea domain containing protein n=1 Tax=Sporothrix bragantina TaxID=671064 RepID=A0ABP0B2A0_9PEZI